jgi:RimJ/RimL family protein N-acetyltransferase
LSARVRLRPAVVADIDALVASRDGSGEIGPSADELRDRLPKQIAQSPTLARDGFFSLVVESEGRLIGDIQARAPKKAYPPGVCEIGISLFPDARGQGFGREAVTLFTELLFESGMERVQASTALDNVAMRRVLEHVGYEFEGVLRFFMPDDAGAREDYALYAVVKPDWAR